jgi:hypothetical protein
MGERRFSASMRAPLESAKRAASRTSLLDARAREAIERLVRMLTRCGLSRADVSRELHRAADQVLEAPDSLLQEGAPPGEVPVRGEFALASQVLSEWCTDPKYADAGGRPAALPKHGRRSLAVLTRRISRSLDVKQVIEYLTRTGSIERSGSRRYRVVRRWVLTRGTGTPNHFWSLGALLHTLRTLEHNLRSPSRARSWFYRIAERTDVPLRKVAEIDRLVDRKGMAFLRWFDAYLHQCAAERRPGEPTVWYGLGVQRFQRDAALPAPRRASRRRNAREGRRGARGPVSLL